MFIDLGHRFRKSPKCHPETAGEGIEYCWGKSKFEYRKHNDCKVAHQRETAMASLSPTVLTMHRIRLFERKAWTYKRAYLKLASGASLTPLEHADIERQTKEQKKHRSCHHKAADVRFIMSA